MHWRLIDAPSAAGGAENMALDQLLLEGVQAGGRPVLRLYRWRPPCLSLGRGQLTAGRFDRRRAAALGIDVVRRPTGGLAVWHDRELTYAVAVPLGRLGSPRATYLAVNRALCAGLRRLGVEAEVAAPAAAGVAAGVGAPPSAAGPAVGGRGLPPYVTGGACFRAAAPGEVVAGARKLIGSAQRCERRAILQHGSLLLDGDQDPVAELLPGTPAGPPPATLRSLLGRVPAWTDLTDAVRVGFQDHLGIRLAPEPLSDAERVRARALVEQFRSAAWTWRR